MSANPIIANRNAFTLVELIVLVAMIAILAAILFPVFAQARDKARTTTCISNLKQIGLGITQYIQDNDETICPFGYPTSSGARYWYGTYNSGTGVYDMSQGLLQPYMKNVKIQDCPNAPPITSATGNRPVAYGFNYDYLYFPTYSGDPSSPDYAKLSGNPIPAALCAFDSPSETIMMSGNGFIEPNTGSMARYSLIRPPSQSTYYDGVYGGTYGETVHGLHQGCANVLWCDGHASARRVKYNPKAGPVEIENDLGDVINPSYPYGSANQDYYFQLRKP
jgi:prepilin-type processing-associated H-X9-DG protein